MLSTSVKKRLSTIRQLERDRNLKQLQINRLLHITQAINNNAKTSSLFDMYASFLSWEMGVEKMALFFRKEKGWECMSSVGIDKELLGYDISEQLSRYTRLNKLADNDHPLVKNFDMVIPVKQRDTHLACAFIGGFSEEDDMYSKVQFITAITNIIAVAVENKRLQKEEVKKARQRGRIEFISLADDIVESLSSQNEGYSVDELKELLLKQNKVFSSVSELQKTIIDLSEIDEKTNKAIQIEITIPTNFSEFDKVKQGILIGELENLVNAENPITVKSIKKGSVKIVIELEGNSAQSLLNKFILGNLDELNITRLEIQNLDEKNSDGLKGLDELLKFKSKVKNLLVQNLKSTISNLCDIVNPGSDKIDGCISLHERVLRLEKNINKSLITNSEYDLIRNKIVSDSLALINSLNSNDIIEEGAKLKLIFNQKEIKAVSSKS